MPSQIAADLAQLARLASDGGLDLRQVALRVKADLLLCAVNPAAEDMAAFHSMAAALIPVIDDATATILARKLAGWPHAPQEILALLRARGSKVFAALIGHGMPLAPAEIEEVAADGAAEARLALARRPDLTAAAVTILAGHGEPAIDLALAANAAVPLPRAALDQLVGRARSAPALGLSLLARSDLPAAELTPLFLQATPAKRQAMIEAAAAYEALVPSTRRAPLSAEQLSGLVATALVDRTSAFAALAEMCGAGPGLAQAFADDHSRQLAALALIGSGARPEDATRFLIGLGDDTAFSVERIFALVEMMRAVAPAAARRLVLQIGGGAKAGSRQAVLQPAMDPSGTPVRPGAERPAIRGSVRETLRRLGGNAG